MADEHWVRSSRAGHPAWLHDPDPDDRPGDYGGGLGLWVERMLLKLAIVGLVALVLVQVLLTLPQFHRLMVLVDRMEGHLSVLAGEAAGGATPVPGAPPAARPGMRPAGGANAPGAPAPGANASGAKAAGASASGAAAPGVATSGAKASGANAAGAGAAGADAADSAVAAVPAAAPGARRHLTIALVSHPSSPARLLVDNRPAGDFAEGRVTVAVAPGQHLAIAGGAAEASLVFRVVQVAGLQSPPLGAEWTVQGGAQSLGPVR